MNQPNLCPSCSGQRCADCAWTGRASAYRHVVDRTRALVAQILVAHRLADPRDLDRYGRWLH